MCSLCFKIRIFQKFLFLEKNKILYLPPQKYTVVVAQQVRVADCGSVGRGFESHLPPKKQSLGNSRALLFFWMEFYTYILESESSDMLYIGQTANLEDRLFRHNHGNSRFTKNKGPWKLLFSIKMNSRSDAILLESKLKKFKNRERILRWIEIQLSENH